MALRLLAKLKDAGQSKREQPRGLSPTSAKEVAPYTPAQPVDISNDPLEQMYQQGRHSVILQSLDRWESHSLGARYCADAARQLEHLFAIVPAGSVTLPESLNAEPNTPETEVDVAPFLMSRFAVTNEEYQHFVDAGCYEMLDLWPEEIWPHLIEMQDMTGTNAPRYWRDGRHDQRLARNPVVGVSWYEASAYGRWLGLRLPTESEWQMATSWHIQSSVDLLRRFPWGDAMDAKRCNIWITGKGETVNVDQYDSGAAPNGVLQLVGNVWEWLSTEFQIIEDQSSAPIVGEMPMRSIRGGAFDTYFESQCVSTFRTGQLALGRTYNIGFRLACDVDDAIWLDSIEGD
jgi:iron(II)-dependent oxidoreductase